MSAQQISSLVSFIWGIADDCLRDVYVRGKYFDATAADLRAFETETVGLLDQILEDER